MVEISLNDVEKYYGANKVLKKLKFQVLQRERVGIVGRNETGKTTIFRIICGVEKCDSGSIAIRKGASVGWLESFLSEYKGTVIIISHDRYFLDKVVNKVIEVEGGKGNTYFGNYSFYVEEKEKKLLRRIETL